MKSCCDRSTVKECPVERTQAKLNIVGMQMPAEELPVGEGTVTYGEARGELTLTEAERKAIAEFDDEGDTEETKHEEAAE